MHSFDCEFLFFGLCTWERERRGGAFVGDHRTGRDEFVPGVMRNSILFSEDSIGECWVSDGNSIVLTIDCAFIMADVARGGFESYRGTRREDCVFLHPVFTVNDVVRGSFTERWDECVVITKCNDFWSVEKGD